MIAHDVVLGPCQASLVCLKSSTFVPGRERIRQPDQPSPWTRRSCGPFVIFHRDASDLLASQGPPCSQNRAGSFSAFATTLVADGARRWPSLRTGFITWDPCDTRQRASSRPTTITGVRSNPVQRPTSRHTHRNPVVCIGPLGLGGGVGASAPPPPSLR